MFNRQYCYIDCVSEPSSLFYDFSMILQMAAQVESATPNQIPDAAQDWMMEEDLKSLPRG